jgi:ABC-2 type transport system permease protein
VTTLERPTTGAGSGRPAAGRRGFGLRPHVLWAIFQRDFLGYFSNPGGYVFITLFVLASSWVAFGLPEFFANNLATLNTLNRWMPYLLLFFIPAVTMSVWAEERRQGTEELLLTLPARDVEVVLGKYLAAVGIFTVALLFSLSHVVVLRFLGRPDAGVMFATYLGYWLMGAMLIALGMAASMLSANATVAFILGALLCALPVFADLVGGFVGAVLPGLGRLLESLSVPSQFRDFGNGVIPLSGVLYFVALAAGMLYVNMVLLGRRHWTGGPLGRALSGHYAARVAAMVVALASVIVLAAHWGARADVSAEGLNTLSATSRALIRQIPEGRPVFIQAYYSEDVPREYVEAKLDLLNLLKEIQAVGGPRVQLKLIPTRRYSQEARDAESRFGIVPRRVFTSEEAKQSAQEIFLGVAFNSGPEQVVVPFLDRGLPVEYELVRSLRVVTGTKRKKVGILQTDARLLGGMDFPTMSQDSEWEVVTELKKQYEVTSVNGGAPLPTDLDALVVAQPSALPQGAIDNLTAYVQAGGPALLLMDPFPLFDPSISPREPRQAPGMMGMSQPPEPKGDLSGLLAALGVAWPDEQIVWNQYNPHPQLAELPPEFLFLGLGSGARDAFAKDPATAGLQEVVLLFGGLLRSSGGPNEFTPLLRTNDLGGTLTWMDTVQRGLMGLTLNRYRSYLPSGVAYTVAARVKGGAPADPAKQATAKGMHAIVVADLDLISDEFFRMRRERPEAYDFLNFDNVSFVLNCVDTLVGDESFVDLRSRRPQHRTLAAVETATRKFIDANQQESKRLDEKAKDELAKAQKRLDEKVEQIRSRKDIDERTKDIMLLSTQNLENRRLAVSRATIEAERDRAKEASRAVREQRVRGIQGRIKALAILLPPLPALLLAGWVYAVRRGRENRGASPNRLA